MVGYDGFLSDQNGNKIKSIIVKAFDRTQPKGVFAAQFYSYNAEKKLALDGKPKLMPSPDLPFLVDNSIKPNYYAEELFASVNDYQDKGDVVILSHHNPAVNADGIRRYFTKYSNLQAPSKEIVTFALAPQEKFGDFFEFTVKEAINKELKNPATQRWIDTYKKSLKISFEYGEKLIYETTASYPI